MRYSGYTYKGPNIQCKDCTERRLACHDHCEKYQTALAEWLEYKKAIKREKHLAKQYDGFAIESTIRKAKRR